jgi:hypothetical protein
VRRTVNSLPMVVKVNVFPGQKTFVPFDCPGLPACTPYREEHAPNMFLADRPRHMCRIFESVARIDELIAPKRERITTMSPVMTIEPT